MTVLALEGPSGVGKTTTAERLCERFDAHRVPEVNELFDRPSEASETWYFERQCDRWRRAVARERDHEFVVLDGDTLQPLWYNWFRTHVPRPDGSTDPFATVERVGAFFGERIRTRAVGFPDRYVVLGADEGTLRRRRDGDATRRRRNFEYHLRLVGPQRAYFERLRRQRPGLVRFVEATGGGTVGTVASLRPDGRGPAERYDRETFDGTVAWLDSTDPNGP